jgi:hypothetical protein
MLRFKKESTHVILFSMELFHDLIEKPDVVVHA